MQDLRINAHPAHSHPIKLLISLAALFVVAFWTTGPALANHPNQPQGFDPERAYQISPQQIDHVDLYSGTLSARIPIGPFSLFYNSNVWRYSTDTNDNIVAQPDRLTSAGLGWHVGWGEVYEPDHWYNDSERWLYIGDDGNRHYFYSTLHYDDGNGVANVFYTRDGSYLRMKLDPVNRCWAEIEFPDGLTRRFGRSSCGPNTALRWTYAWDRFGSLADPDLTITYNSTDTQRTVTDRYNRVHRVNLTDQYPWMIRTITSIDLESVGGQRAVTTFEYDNINVDRSCKDNSGTTGPRISVPHLKKVSFPDGSEYSMVDGGALQYHNNCGTIDDVPGVLKGLILPTGGKLEWDFQEYEFPPGGTNSVFNTSAGVATRRVLESDGTELGRREYKTTSIGAVGGNDPEMRTEVVVFPEGDCSRHFFNAIYWIDPNPVPKGWENTLAFTYTESSGGRYLSTQQWTGNDGSGSCSGSKLRSTYLRFRRDTLPGNTNDISEWRDSNRQVDAVRVVFHDDGGKYIDTEMSQFDGLGQFRKTVTTGNLYSSSTSSERREVTVEFNRSSGVYPGTYTPLPPSEPWILGTYDAVQTEEVGAEGETLTRLETEFDSTTGELVCSRQLTSGATQSDADLLTLFTTNSLGFVTDIKQYGGDNDPIGVGQSASCGAVVNAPVYWQHRTYEDGRLKTARPRHPNGTNGSFLTYDVDLDPFTGRVIAQRDSAGYETTFEYDLIGRLTKIVPQDAAEIERIYTHAVGTSPAKIHSVSRAFGGGAVLREHEVVFDSLGRAELERTRMPGSVWSEQESSYNARGWMTSRSEVGDLTAVTTYTGFDPFGRPGTVTPPEGSAHEVLFSYLGDRQVTRSLSIATGVGGTQSVETTTQTRDSHGRLRTVTEPSGPNGGNTATSYGYDVGGRLTRISSGPGFQHQFRSFSYDNRGFMLSESHPETGVVTYEDYDAGGLSHRKTDGAHDLGMTYDFAGRLLTVFDKNQADRLVKQFWYDGAAGLGNGKLWKAARHNYLELPWSSPGVDDVLVSDVYDYSGIGGAVDQKDTFFAWPDRVEQFRQTMTYNDLRQVTQVSYPKLVLGTGDTTATTGRSVSFGYTEGLLTSIPGYVDAISYHPSGLWSKVEHSNNVDHWQTEDSDRTRRTGRIYTTGANIGGMPPVPENYDSGTYAYDGAGNIRATGKETFRYDEVSRLVEKSGNIYQPGQPPQGHQTFSYDRFGNLTERVTDGSTETFSVDANTNRLSNGTYDGAGNLLQLGNQYFGYNTSNRVVSQAWMRYVYDASDERAAAFANVPQRVVSFTLRDPQNRRLSRFEQTSGTISRERDWVYGGSRLLASETPTGERYHYYADHLGTPRLIANGSGLVEAHQCILPYGEEQCEAGKDNVKLGGHERDASYDSDYMHARHYLAGIGRFLSVDPLRGRASVPQSLNRYAYVMGNPMRYSDPDGRNEDGSAESPFQEAVDVWSWFFRRRGGGSASSNSGDAGGDGSSPPAGEIAIDPDDRYEIEETPDPEPERPEEPEMEEEEEEDDPCKLKLKLDWGVAGSAAAYVGAAGWHSGGFNGPRSTTGLLGAGATPVPGIHGFFGLKLGQGIVSGTGYGGLINATLGPGISIKFNFGNNGAWFISVNGGFGSPHGGAVVGATETIVSERGERTNGQGCP